MVLTHASVDLYNWRNVNDIVDFEKITVENFHQEISWTAGPSEWPSWQRRKSCGNSRTFAWVRVQLQTGVLSLLFSTVIVHRPLV